MEKIKLGNNTERNDIEDAEIISEGNTLVDSNETGEIESVNDQETQETEEGVREKESSLESGVDQINDPEEAFAEVKQEFEEIIIEAEKLKDTVTEMQWQIKSAESAIASFENLSEEDKTTRKNSVQKSYRTLNKAVGKIKELIKENKDESENAEEIDKSLEEQKSEIISQFNEVQFKFEKVKSKAYKIDELKHLVSHGDSLAEQFNEDLENNVSDEVIQNLQNKKVALENLIKQIAYEVDNSDRIQTVERDPVDNGVDKENGEEQEEQQQTEEEVVDIDDQPVFDDEIITETNNDSVTVNVEKNDESLQYDDSEKNQDDNLENDQSPLHISTEDNIEDDTINNLDLGEVGEGEDISIENKEELVDDEKSGLETEFKKERAEWYANRKQYYEDKEKYNTALKKFYEDRKLSGKIFDKGRSFLGLKPKLPEEITKLEEEYKRSRNIYATGLDSVLKKRSVYKNEDYAGLSERDVEGNSTDASNKVKRLFAKKFVLRPSKETTDLQKAEVLSEEHSVQLKRILGILNRNKWTVKVGFIAAGAAGAASAGVFAALTGGGMVAGRMLVGTAAGSVAGGSVNWLTGLGVDKAKENVKVSLDDVERSFSLDKLDELENKLLDSERKFKAALAQQKTATVGAGVVAGGWAGANFSTLGSDAINTADSVVEKASSVTSEQADNAVETIKEVFDENSELANAMSGDATSEVTPSYESEPVESAEVEKTVEKEEISPLTETIKAEQIVVPNYAMDGSEHFQTVVSDIKLNGAEDLNGMETTEVEQYIRLATNDLLSAHPNLTSEQLSAELLGKLENKFSDNAWWESSPVTEVEIGQIDRIETNDLPSVQTNTATAENALNNEVVDSWKESADNQTVTTEDSENSLELPSNIYEVEAGDELWNIVTSEYGDILQGLSTQEQNTVLSHLFNNVQSNDELLDSLNLKSGDVDLIYQGEELELKGLGEELKRLVEMEKNGDLSSYVDKTGSLEVTADADQSEYPPVNFAEEGGVDKNLNFDPAYDTGAAENTKGLEYGVKDNYVDSNHFEHTGAISGEKAVQVNFVFPEEVSPEVKETVSDFIKTTTNEVASNPNLDGYGVKVEVWNQLYDKFGDESWWRDDILTNFEVQFLTNTNLPQEAGGASVEPMETVSSGMVTEEGLTEVQSNGQLEQNIQTLQTATSVESEVYQKAISEAYPDERAFNLAVQNTVKEIEDDTIGLFDFGVDGFYENFNDYYITDLKEMEDMDRSEVEEFFAGQGKDVKYETFRAWSDFIKEVEYDQKENPEGFLNVVEKKTTLEDLLSRYVVMSDWIEKNRPQAYS